MRIDRIKLCAVLLLWAALASLQAQEGSVSEIQQLIRGHQYDQALDRTRAALQRTPGDVRLWTLEGIVLSIQGNLGEALSAYQKALAISPDYSAALKGAVQLLYATQDKRAEPLLNQILKTDPNDATAHEMLGSLKKAHGDCPGAVKQFALIPDAIATHPGSLEAYGACLVETQQVEKAIPVFEQLVAALPEQTFPKYDLAVVLIDAKRYDAALKILQPLLAASPSDVDLLSLASEAYEATGDTPKAVALLRQAIVLSPADANLYSTFASLCLNHDSFQVGIDMIDAGLEKIKGDGSLFLARGVLYAQLADFDKAEADFNTAERLNATQSLSSYAIDLSEMQRNQSQKLDSGQELASIRAHVKAHPESAFLHYLLAKRLANDQQQPNAHSVASSEAIEQAQLAIKIKPDLTEARDLLASLYLRLNNYPLAIEQSRLALHDDPVDESALYHLVIALRHSGNAHDEIGALVQRLTELQKTSMQQDTNKKRFRLVEEQTASTK